MDIPRRNPQTLYGQHQLSSSYSIYILYRGVVEEFAPVPIQDPPVPIMLPTNHSVIKPLVSIMQITYGSFEPYRTRADQLTIHGYGAYSLICIPYIIMSFVNLLAALLCHEYPCLFLAESVIMEEARSRGCIFNGTVGVARPRTTNLPEPIQPAEDLEFLVPGSSSVVTVTDQTIDGWKDEKVQWNQIVSSNPYSR